MGFRENGFMTVWGVEQAKAGNVTRVRLSASRKNKKTGEYEQDFSGFCTFIGKAHDNASFLKERDRIKILSCDVSTSYDKDKGVGYVNYKVFDFEMADGSKPFPADKKAQEKPTAFEENNEPAGGEDEDNLPF